MFKSARFKYALSIILGICLFGIKFARAAEDDSDSDSENILGEIIFDLIMGVGIGVCQENPTCNAWLMVITFIAAIITFIIWCTAGCNPDSCSCGRKDVRRGLTIYGGTSIGRNWARH